MYARTTSSYWWSNTLSSATQTNALSTNTNVVLPRASGDHGHGFAWRCSLGLPTTNTENVPAKANQLANFPLNFLRTGLYRSSSGNIDYRTTEGAWWLATRSSSANANHLVAGAVAVYPQRNNAHGFGFAVRWGAVVEILLLVYGGSGLDF